MNDQERLIVIAAIAEIAKSKASSNSLGAPQETSIKNLMLKTNKDTLCFICF